MSLSHGEAIKLVRYASRYITAATLYQSEARFEFVANHYAIDIRLDLDGAISIYEAGRLWGAVPGFVDSTPTEIISVIVRNRLRTVIDLACRRALADDTGRHHVLWA